MRAWGRHAIQCEKTVSHKQTYHWSVSKRRKYNSTPQGMKFNFVAINLLEQLNSTHMQLANLFDGVSSNRGVGVPSCSVKILKYPWLSSKKRAMCCRLLCSVIYTRLRFITARAAMELARKMVKRFSTRGFPWLPLLPSPVCNENCGGSPLHMSEKEMAQFTK